MEYLFEKHFEKQKNLDATFVRYIDTKIDWEEKLIGIKGARGVGKTTYLLQYIKKNFKTDRQCLYVSLDDLYFTENRLTDLTSQFLKYGGKYLFIDEVHRYPTWAQELKNIYDDYPTLKIVFTGSSILHLISARSDLSRRAILYHMQGLSFREFINLTTKVNLDSISFTDIIENHEDISVQITHKLKPLPLFSDYLKYGYYPFFLQNIKTYNQKVSEVINLMLEIDLPQTKNIPISNIIKLKKLLRFLSTSVPFKPNVTELSSKIGITRNSLITYLQYLQEADLINMIFSNSLGGGILQKPEQDLPKQPESYVCSIT